MIGKQDTTGRRDLWVFAYGSLMWRPGFDFEAAHAATLTGYHRAFCVYSVFYRGSPQRPGLVLGLDRGGVCQGMAFRVAAQNAAQVLRYLRAREQITGVYRETLLPISMPDLGIDQVQALTFVVERNHPGYAGALGLAEQAHMIRAATGQAGCNLDYALSTISHLHDMGCPEPRLTRLVSFLGPVFSRNASTTTHAKNTFASRRGALVQALMRFGVRARRVRQDQRKRFCYRDYSARRLDESYLLAAKKGSAVDH